MQIIAVVVTYHPDFAVLTQLLDGLASQVSQVVIVDNGSPAPLATQIAERGRATEHWLALGDNQGIAAAQNVGITQAKALGADYVILFDHDSNPMPDMVAHLVSAAERLQAQGQKLAAVGPRYLDERQNNPPPFIRVEGLKLIRCSAPTDHDTVPVDYLIASGCLMPMSTLDAVGLMAEPLFIDYVDIEWGQRARSQGYQSYGCFSALMQHTLGDEPIQFCGRSLPLHSPLRHYYHFRNAVWLYRQKWVPRHWKIVDAWRLLLKYGFYTLFAKPHAQQWWMMTKGVWHGLTGRSGKL